MRAKGNKMIATDRLILRKFNKEDINDFHEIFSQTEVVKYLPIEPLTYKEAVDKLDNIINNLSDLDKEKPKFILAVQLKENNKVIGWVGSGPLPFAEEKIELFYALHSVYWKKGFAFEAASGLLNFLRDEYDIKPIYALVDDNNRGSVKILKKLNFTFEKKVEIEKDKYRFFNGLDLYKLKE
ncbi:MAG TPA: GNAT family N-acetyltransferase [Halanaerobiales bacterium]|nr:GNAT family N-acetyltransferase [Halanaerobiales bacterium]